MSNLSGLESLRSGTQTHVVFFSIRIAMLPRILTLPHPKLPPARPQSVLEVKVTVSGVWSV